MVINQPLVFSKKSTITHLLVYKPVLPLSPSSFQHKPRKMQEEISNFIRVWAVAIASACYAYSLTRIFYIPKGIPRLIFILPVIYLFIVLPLSLSSFHLCGPTVLYLVWMGTFKLVLYSFDLGPLSTNPNLSLLHFVCSALLPIKVKDEPRSSKDSNPQNKGYPPHDSKINGDPDGQIKGRARMRRKLELGKFLLFCVKLVAFALVIKIYDYKDKLPSYIMFANYSCHLYLLAETTLAMSAALVRATLGLELDPQFNQPYLSTSLQDFWGRRWNLMMNNIMRLLVYNPVRRGAAPLVGRTWAMAGGTMAAFVVSGIMHEVLFFYLTHVPPTWEVTCYFVLHGVCTVAEVAVKEAVGGRFRLPRVVSGLLTAGFVVVTGWWLFLPQILRNGVEVKAVRECHVMIDFVKQNVVNFFG